MRARSRSNARAARRRTRTARRSSAAIVPWRTSASKLITSRQYAEPYRSTGMDRSSFLRLRERQDLEQLVERAEAARKSDQRVRQVREPQLAHEEVVELEAQLGRDIGVGTLLLRQADVEPDAAPAGERGAAVGRFHDAGTTARAHQQPPAEAAAPLGHQPRQLRGLIEIAPEVAAGAQPCRAEEHDRGADAREAEGAQRRQVFRDDADRPAFVGVDELRIVISKQRCAHWRPSV